MQAAPTKRAKRLRQPAKPEPLYLWLPVYLLAAGDVVVANQQELKVKGVSHKEAEDEWQVMFVHPETRQRSEDFYRRHQFAYVKATESVKERLTNQERAK
jgi:hypothetical protein